MTHRIGNHADPGQFARRVWLGFAIAATLSSAGCISTVGPSGSGGLLGGAAGTAVPTAVSGPTGPTPIPSFVRPTPTPAPTFLVYVVKAGDSLDTIAHRYGTTGRSIAFWNRGTYPTLDPEARGYRPDLVRIGWILVLIPHAVVDEQTLPEPTPNPTGSSEAQPLPS
jgi:hypothetical protein